MRRNLREDLLSQILSIFTNLREGKKSTIPRNFPKAICCNNPEMTMNARKPLI